MPTAFDEITLGYKIASTGLDIRGRKAFILEARNPPIGNQYKISWKW